MADAFSSMGNMARLEGKKSLQKLQHYLKVKGILLRRKIAPSGDLFREGDIDAEFMNEFVGNTDLMDHAFWRKLDKGRRTEALKYMSLRDNIPHRVVSTGTKKKADLFIVISGTGTEKNMRTGAVQEVKIGSVLGAVDMFNRCDDPDFQDPEEPDTFVSTLKQGCLVRLRLSDFIMSQYGPEVDKEAEYLASLKPAERLVYESRKLATSSISPGLFDILDANDLLPTDPDDPSFRYLCKGNINRRIELRRGEPSSVFIILSGSLEITLMRHMKSILALKEEDDSESIAVKINGTPLVRVEAGTLLCIDDTCFSPPSLFGATPSGAASVADTSASSTGPDAKPTPQLSRGYSSNTILSNLESDFPSGVPSSDRSPDELPLFHLDLVFKSTCNYIRLPKRELKNALKEENYATTTEIVRQLSVVSQSIISRISDLDIWNSANIGIRCEEKEPVAGSTWGAEQKTEHKSQHLSGKKVISGLHGTYKLPSAVPDAEEEDGEQEDPPTRGMLPPMAPLLAKKTTNSQVFNNTALLEDDM